MKPSSFQYHAPGDVSQAVSLLVQFYESMEEAKLLAGGQSLVPMMNLRLARPEHLIDLQGLSELDFLSIEGRRIVIGSLATHRRLEVDSQLYKHAPIVRQIAGHIAHRQVRNSGTFGGSVAHADPAAEWPLLCALTDATMHVSGPVERVVSANRFFTGHYSTELEDTEVLTHVEIELPAGDHGFGFWEFARRHGDFALGAAGAIVVLDQGRIAEARVVLAAASDRPLLVPFRSAIGKTPEAAVSEESLASLKAAIEESVSPASDAHATAAYRSALLAAAASRAWSAAIKDTSEKRAF